jgi:hypothetical protein
MHNNQPTWEDMKAFIRTPLEEIEAIGHTLHMATYQIEQYLQKNRNAESSWGIGDFITAGADHPVLIKYVYADTGLIQGFRAGPLLVLRLRPDSEQAVELWLDPEEELEARMPRRILAVFRDLREAIHEMDNDPNLDPEFELPQVLIDNFSPDACPCVLRTGTLRNLTRPSGNPVTDDALIALAVYESAQQLRGQFKEMVSAAVKARALILNARKPRLENADAPSRKNAKATQHYNLPGTIREKTAGGSGKRKPL